jgi:uroporphyrinogen-III decarboxylase
MADVPPGKVCYWFEEVDMARAKEVLGETACIAGGVPLPLLTIGTPGQVRDCCRDLIDIAGKNGGYILGPGGDASTAKLENLKTMVDTAKEYGVYC